MPAEFEYKIIKESSHDKLTTALNTEAAEGWEPINVYLLGIGTAEHFALLRRPLKA
jgi:hypothetical protein